MIITCPHCEVALPEHAHIGRSDVTPTPEESATVCAACGEVSVFTQTPLGVLLLRAPTEEEYMKSWWAMHMEGGRAPAGAFRDPGGSDRAADK